MSTFFKVCFLFLMTVFVLSSCVPAETAVPATGPSTVASIVPLADQAPALRAVPQQKDLIFIDFFAGT